MKNSLPARPHLDHLRRQAKALLAALAEGDSEAMETLRQHLPAARGLTPEQIQQGTFRLADAQSAIARKSGFANWPQLARHVDQLRNLEGEWRFESLEVGGHPLPSAMLQSSRILIDGDRFRTESPEATYEGIFNIDVESAPHHIDIHFGAGPEAGNTNTGIFHLEGDRLTICLDTSGGLRPAEFSSRGGAGFACEVLLRTSTSRPENVTGGTSEARAEQVPETDAGDFTVQESPLMQRLQGAWKSTRLVLDGREMPRIVVNSGERIVERNHIVVRVGGSTVLDALFRINEAALPIQIDYLHSCDAGRGILQRGILAFEGEELIVNMAAPGQERPLDLESVAGQGRTLSRWRHKG